MPSSFRRLIHFSSVAFFLALTLAGHAIRLGAAPSLVAIFDGEEYEQDSVSAAPVATQFTFAVGVDFAARVSGVNVTVQPPGKTPIAVPLDDPTSFYLERTFPTRAALDAAFPEGRYTVSTSGSQTGSFQLDLTGGKPLSPRIVSDDFYPNENVLPGWLTIDWTVGVGGNLGNAMAFSQIKILTEAGDVVASSPEFGSTGAGSGASAHQIFQNIPRADTYIGEISVLFYTFSQQGSTDLLVGRAAATRFRIRRRPPPDLTPPNILSITPGADERVSDGSGPITLVFDKPMDRTNPQKISAYQYVARSTISEVFRDVGELTWSADARTVTVRFVPPLPTGFYTFHASSFRDTAGNGANASEFPFVVGTPRPWIITAPFGPVVAPGATVTYSVIAKGPDISYQWYRDGRLVAGARSAVWRPVVDWTAFNQPYIEVEVSSAGGRDRPGATTFPRMVTPPEYPLLTNLSIRNRAGSSDRPLVTGFVVSGASPSLPLLLRGIGPGLAPFGVAGVLPDPQLKVQPSGGGAATLADDFDGSPALTAAAANVGAFALAAPSKDAVLAYTAVPGAHTATIITGDGREGIALAEIYRTTGSSTATVGPVLSNISARAVAGVGADALIAGFTISPSRYRKGVLIRGVGPGLAPFGVTGVLANPKIVIYRSGLSSAVAENDNWESQFESFLPVAPFAQAVGAFPLPKGSKDASIIVYLDSGTYTVQVVGADGGTGVALIEIYDL